MRGSRHPSKKQKPAAAPRRRKRPAAALKTDVLTTLLGFHLRMANVAMYRDFKAAMHPLDMTQRQSALLMLILRNPGASQIALADLLGTDRATMMGIVDRLEAQNLLERRQSDSDRRLKGLFLTAKGKSLVAELKRRIAKLEIRFLNPLSAREVAQFRDFLTRLYRLKSTPE